MSESIQNLHVEHILKRPDSYVGPVSYVANRIGYTILDTLKRKVSCIHQHS